MGNLRICIKNLSNLNQYTIVLLLIIIDNASPGPNDLHFSVGTLTSEVVEGDVFFEIIYPEELGYTYRIRPALDFGAPFNVSMQFKHVKLVPTIPRHGCSNILNSEEIAGHIALTERGECTFILKSFNAQKAGARALIVTEARTKPEESLEFLIEMVDDSKNLEVDIPTGFLMGRNGAKILNTLSQLHLNHAIINMPVNVSNVPIHKINQPPWIQW